MKKLYILMGILNLGLIFQNCEGLTSGQFALSSQSDTGGNDILDAWDPLKFPTTMGTSGATFKRVFANLNFEYPMLITSARDGSDRLFVVERAGRIKVFQNSDSVTTSSTFLDIASKVSLDGEEGLLGLAFSPDYATSGYFYVYYSPNSGLRRSRFSRFKVSTGNPNLADPSSEKVILEVKQPAGSNIHKSGTINFGPDGFLYIGLGDGGGAGDPNKVGQNTKQMLGKILRINPRSGDPYSIPTDNPYYTPGGALCNITVGVVNCPEIYAYGVRNPFRWSFDRQTGALWVADVGQRLWEEIDIVKKGDNLGWSAWEGNHVYEDAPSPPPQAAPIFEYDHTVGRSITGGYVYRGTAIPKLIGSYIYGDYVVGKVWALRYNGSAVTSNEQIGLTPNLVAFGEDEAGELYSVNLVDGIISKLIPSTDTSPNDSLPQKLSQTGLFKDLASLSPKPGVIEYEVNSPLWSDGAEKKRWLALPEGSQIDFSKNDPWTFPKRTVLVKHFEIRLSTGSIKRLETRVLVHMTEGWTGFTYKWNNEGTDALLSTTASEESLMVRDTTGANRTVKWLYPSSNQCMQCHTSVSGYVQGIHTAQINRNFTYEEGTMNQISAWKARGYLKGAIPALAELPAFANLSDTSKSLSDKSRSYLASNCAMCHQPGGPTPTNMDFKYSTSLSGTKTVGIAPTSGGLGLTTPQRIFSGSKEKSVLWERLRRTDNNRMPALGTSIPNTDAVEVIGNWIDQME